MINYKHRKNQIHILTLDNILATDLRKRLKAQPGLQRVKIILPSNSKNPFSVENIYNMALDTTCSRVLIFDVRNYTLVRLQQAYNKIVGYNRGDFNVYCYTVLIGDGPAEVIRPDIGLNIFVSLLAKSRIDYSPAVFFYDPLLNYGYDEKFLIGLESQYALPEKIPVNLQKGFNGKDVNIKKIRQYLRAEHIEGDLKVEKKTQRLQRLWKLYQKIISEQYHDDIENTQKCLSMKGFGISGEALQLNVYPFYFEEWVAELMAKAKEAIHPRKPKVLDQAI